MVVFAQEAAPLIGLKERFVQSVENKKAGTERQKQGILLYTL